MKSKLEQFYSGVSDLHYNVLCLGKAWLTSSILNSEIVPSDYCVLRADRNLSEVGLTKGGGSLIAVNIKMFKCVALVRTIYEQ